MGKKGLEKFKKIGYQSVITFAKDTFSIEINLCLSFCSKLSYIKDAGVIIADNIPE